LTEHYLITLPYFYCLSLPKAQMGAERVLSVYVSTILFISDHEKMSVQVTQGDSAFAQ
jgi:hypothetical protein